MNNLMNPKRTTNQVSIVVLIYFRMGEEGGGGVEESVITNEALKCT